METRAARTSQKAYVRLLSSHLHSMLRALISGAVAPHSIRVLTCQAKPEKLLYAAFLTMVVRRSWHRMLRHKMGALSDLCRTERWAAIFRMVAADLLAILARPSREAAEIARRIMSMIREELIDSNAERVHSFPGRQFPKECRTVFWGVSLRGITDQFS